MGRRISACVISALLAVALSVVIPAFAQASVGTEISSLPALDQLNRNENPLSNGGKWSPLTGAANAGQDTTAGWIPANGFPTLNGAYWNAASFSDKTGVAAAVTMATVPGISERYLSLWLDSPAPGTAKTGYELRWTVEANNTSYAVKLSKWSAGTETVLATKTAVSLAAGTTMAIADSGTSLSVWQGTGGSLSELLSANDSAFSNGYAGLSGSGSNSRSTNFKAGVLNAPPATIGGEIAALTPTDPLNRNENPLSNGGKWSPLLGAANAGQDTTAGWIPVNGFPTLNGAYWNPTTFSDKTGVAAAVTMATVPGISERYLSLWLDAATPGSVKTGYELRWTVEANNTSYAVKLSKWSAGVETVLATKTAVSLPAGTTMAVADSGTSLSVWQGTSSLSELLSANDSTYSSGYAGLSGSGSNSRSTNFKAGALAPPGPGVLSTAATAIKSTGATLNAEVNANGQATTYQFEWGTTTSYGKVVPATAKSAGSGSTAIAVSEALTGLAPDTAYHFRITATNANGTSRGGDQTFTTTNQPVATTNVADAVSANGATLHATVNPHGAATTYYFEYGPTTSYGSKAPAAPAGVGSGRLGVAVGQAITGLSEGSTYHFRVIASNEVGTVQGADQTIETPLLPEAVTEGSEAVAANDAIVTGTIDPNGEETSYQFEYGPTTSYGSTVSLEGIEAGDGTQPFEVMAAPTYLQPETTYHYRLLATSSAGKDIGEDKTLATGARVMTPQEEAARAAGDNAYAGSQATLPEDFVGMMWSGLQTDREPAEMEVIRQSGAKILRWFINPLALGPNLQEQPWKDLDTLFKNAAENGMTILPYIDGGQAIFKGAEQQKWADAVTAVANRYGPAGSLWSEQVNGQQVVVNDHPTYWWEIGNENNYYKWNPAQKVDPELFGEYLARTSELLKTATSQQAKVVLGGLIGVHEPKGNLQLKVSEFLEKMHKGRNAFDALGLHPYVFLSGGHEPRTTPQAEDVRDKVRMFIAEARNTLQKIGLNEKRIWITEFGWPVGNTGDATHPGVTEDIQRQLINLTFSMIMNRSGEYKIQHALYYNYLDNKNGDWAGLCGLRASIEHFRLGWYAFRKQAFKDDNYPRRPVAKTEGNSTKAKSSTLQASVNPEGLRSNFYFQWYRVGESGNVHNTTGGPAGFKEGYVPVSEKISGLAPQQSYKYRVIAVNDAREEKEGAWEELKTPPSSSVSANDKRKLHGQPGWVWIDGWAKEGEITGPGPGLANVHVHVMLYRSGHFERMVDVLTNSEGHYDTGYQPVGKGEWEFHAEFPGGGEWDPAASGTKTFTIRDGVLIKAKHSGKCLDVENAGGADGVPVMHGTCNGEANQVFTLTPRGSGQFLELIARHSGKCVDVNGASTADGAALIQHSCNGGTNEAFSEAWWGETPFVSYVAQHSGKCIGVAGGSTGWAPMQQQTCNSGEYQRFELVPVESGPIPTSTSVEVDQVLHGSPGTISLHGHLLAGPYSMAGRVVHVEFDNAAVGGWSTLYDLPVTVAADGSYEYRDYGIQPGYYSIRATFVGNSEFKTSQSGEHPATVKRGYQIVSRNSGRCLSLSENRNVNGQQFLQWDCAPPTNGNGQVFSFWEPEGNGWYQLRVNGTNRCVDVTGASTANGATLQLYDCLGAGQTNQVWHREPIQGQAPWYALMPRHTYRPDLGTYKCADVLGNGTGNGVIDQQWDCFWGANQQWELRGVIDP